MIYRGPFKFRTSKRLPKCCTSVIFIFAFDNDMKTDDTKYSYNCFLSKSVNYTYYFSNGSEKENKI